MFNTTALIIVILIIITYTAYRNVVYAVCTPVLVKITCYCRPKHKRAHGVVMVGT